MSQDQEHQDYEEYETFEEYKARRRPKRIKRERSAVMRILGSTKLTLVLGTIAFASILYYKFFVYKPPKKKKPKKAKAVHVADLSLRDPKGTLGRTRPFGPKLMEGLFRRGDLLLRVHNKKLELGVVQRSKTSITVLSQGKSTLLMPWLKAYGGHYAHFRIDKALATLPPFLKASPKAATSQPSRPLVQRLYQHYKKQGIALPSLTPKQSSQAWLKSLAKQSFYNDLP